MKRFAIALGLAGLLAAGPARAEPKTYQLPEETAALKQGPGVEAAETNCVSCHSADYVNAQPPRKGRVFWEAEVTKMVKVYKAPIEDANVKAIVDYLEKTY